VVFNTGQVISGLVRTIEETREQRFLDCAIRAGNWIVESQERDGSWARNNYSGMKRVYDSYVAAPLAKLAKVTGEGHFASAAVKNYEFALKHQHHNGWFELCDNTHYKNDAQITHTICYSLDGLIETGELLNWLEEEYPGIRERARQWKAQIHWLDEMGLRSDHQAGRSWGRRGETPVVMGTGQRFRCNMISSITNRGRLAFMIFHQRFMARVFLNFLGRLVRLTRKTKRKVFLIVDGHQVHKSRLVNRWLAEHAAQIRIFFLPSYSPELNPDELLNQDVKTNALGRGRPVNVQEMMDNLRSYLLIIQARFKLVKNYLRERHVQYAAS
jgi:hypothetical protein